MLTVEEIFAFHEKNVRVTTTDGLLFSGMCWAYFELDPEGTGDFDESVCYLEIGSTSIFQDEIEKIEELTD